MVYTIMRMLFSRSGDVIQEGIGFNKKRSDYDKFNKINTNNDDIKYKFMSHKPNNAILPLNIYTTKSNINFDKNELIRILKTENNIRLSDEAKMK